MSKEGKSFKDAWVSRTLIERNMPKNYTAKVEPRPLSAKGTRTFVWTLYDDKNRLVETRAGIITTSKWKPDQVEEFLSKTPKKDTSMDDLYE